MAEVAAPSRAASAEVAALPRLRGVRLPQAPQAQPAASAPSATTTSGCACASGSTSCSTTDSFEELSGDLEPIDALSFVDSKPYPERIAAAQSKSGRQVGRAVRQGHDRRAPAGGGRHRLRLHRRQHGRRGRRGDHARAPSWRSRPHPAARDLRVGRRAHAGGLRLADADGQDQPGGRAARRGGDPLHVAAHRPDLRRRERVLRHARRRADRRARGPHRLRRPAGDRADDPPEAARRLPDGRVPAGARDARPRGAAREPAPHDPQPARAPRARRGRALRDVAAPRGCRRPRGRRRCRTPRR